MRFALSFLCVILLISACQKDAVPKSWSKGEMGRVVRVIDGDSFALNTGQIVRLASIEAPSRGYKDREGQPYAEEAAETLKRLALGETVQLYYPGLTRDKYDRALAQAYLLPTGGEPIWLNAALIDQGAAWVRLYPDTASGSDILWEHETAARRSGKGLWAESAPVYSDTPPEGGFVIMSGELYAPSWSDEGNCKLLGDFKDVEVYFRPVSQNSCKTPFTGQVEVRGWLTNSRLNITSAQNIREAAER